MKRLRTAAVLVAALALLAAACGDDKKDDAGPSGATTPSDNASGAFIDPAQDCKDYKPTQGVSGDTIKIGTVTPLSGNFNIYAKITDGIKLYFNAQNAKGGVTAGDGKQYKVQLSTEDDAYDPSQTLTRVKKLVEQDGIFAMVGEVGTANALTARSYMNENCIPSVGLATGAPEWGEADKYPWYIGGLPSYASEAHVYVQWLKEKQPGAKIAVLYQDDDFGKAYLGTIEKEAGEAGLTVADKASFDPRGSSGVEGVVAKLASSKADAFFIGIGGLPCPTALKSIPGDWKPITYVNVTCSGKLAMSLAGGKDEGVYSVQATYDPANAQDATQPSVQEFLQAGAANNISKADLENGIVSAGWGFGAIFAKALEMSKTVTRADIMNTLYSLKDVKGMGMIRDDVPVNTDGSTDPWIIEGLRIIHRQGGQWNGEGETVTFDGKSNSFRA